MTTVIAAALVFTVVVFVHELGHLLAARWAGVLVQGFSIGLGPVEPNMTYHDELDLLDQAQNDATAEADTQARPASRGY